MSDTTSTTTTSKEKKKRVRERENPSAKLLPWGNSDSTADLPSMSCACNAQSGNEGATKVGKRGDEKEI